MKPSLFSMTVILFLLHVRKTSCVDYRYSNCSQTFQCGSIANIGYPYWGQKRPDYCGRPEFELNCTGDAPVMTMESLQFRILDIYNTSYTLNVTRADYWDTYCPSEFSNTTIDSSFFEYTSNTQNMFLYYNCTRSLIGLAGISNQFTCDIDNDTMTGYYTLKNLTSDTNSTVREVCGINVNIPVYQENAQAIQNNLTNDNLVQVLDGGFGLLWDANNSICEACRESNGQCGYNSSTNQFVCFCEDQPFPASCQTTESDSPGSAGFRQRGHILGRVVNALCFVDFVLMYF
ncbi:Wall-associated receptor kinase, C-terminal [Dillenia turbinata]|uniref:non-specific serine/threonine protein kinase n=1 Tax=Dillenia turbinata TaxID=194707 RepID=A0AAN8ZA61_9MAGN